MAVPRVTYALGNAEPAGPLRIFARLHPRFGTPANAVLLQTGMALVILMLGAFDNILAFIIFSSVVFLALTAATLFRGPAPKRWWYPAAPVLFIAGCGILALMLLLKVPAPSLIGAAIVLLGLPVRHLTTGRTVAAPPATERAQP
jgi:APA family basic amino acid/polyamine antiporter